MDCIDTRLIPYNVWDIMSTLVSSGYSCELVGGAVRDIIMGREPKDYDLATDAHPEIVEEMFTHTIPTGKDYGTITVMIGDEGYEITTYRLECDYDGRRPKAVKYAQTLEEDLARRDFTMNAMAIDINGRIYDPFNGQTHIKWEEIHCVGNAEERFKEDKLRALRAVRFAAQYDFAIYRDILQEMDEIDITTLSQERLRDEFNKIIMCDKPGQWLNVLWNLGLLHQIIPAIKPCYMFNQNNPHHSKDIYTHIRDVVNGTEPILELRLAALFHDIGKPAKYTEDENGIGHFYGHHKESAKICREIMTRLRYSNKQIEDVAELVYHHMARYQHLRKASVKKFITSVGEGRLDNLFKLFVADRAASNPPYDFEEIYRLKFACEKILEEEQPLRVADLEVNGHDMMAIGYYGKEVGDILNLLLEMVLNDEQNNHHILIGIAKAYWEEHHNV